MLFAHQPLCKLNAISAQPQSKLFKYQLSKNARSLIMFDRIWIKFQVRLQPHAFLQPKCHLTYSCAVCIRVMNETNRGFNTTQLKATI